MVSAFISDGYEETATVQAVEGLHPECKFTFRPFTTLDVMECAQECDGEKLGPARTVEATWLRGKVSKWNFDEQITVENILRLRPELFRKINSIVTGFAPGGKPKEDDSKNLQKG